MARASIDCEQFRDRATGILVLIPRADVARIPQDGRLELEPVEAVPHAKRQPQREHARASHAAMRAMLATNPALRDDLPTLALQCRVSVRTLQRWIREDASTLDELDRARKQEEEDEP